MLKSVGKNIERLRILKGMKQETFALELGISQSAVSKMERSTTISEHKLKKVAKVLGVDESIIVKFDDDTFIENLLASSGKQSVDNLSFLNSQIIILYERLLKCEQYNTEILELIRHEKGIQ